MFSRMASCIPGVVVGFILLTCSFGLQASASPLPASAHPGSHGSMQQLQKVLLKIVDNERRGKGAGPLTLNARMSGCAARHSQAMARFGRLFHDLAHDACIPFMTAGENIGWEPLKPRAALKMINHLMWAEGPCTTACPINSPLWEAHGHYNNLIDRAFHKIGIGIFIRPGSTWLTEDFTN